MAPRILLADEHLVVIDKPGGMPSVPPRTRLDPPDAAAVLAPRWGRLEAVHRLDRDTSGILVLARTAVARRLLGIAFESRAVAKHYIAVVSGVPPRPDGVIHLPLAADPWRPPRQRADPLAGRPCATRWRTLARSGDGRETLVELEPLTGRSHQLRAHLAWLGMPIVGDALYGRGAAGGRLHLHAARIALPHPRDGAPVALLAPACFPTPAAGWLSPGAVSGAPSAAGPNG